MLYLPGTPHSSAHPRREPGIVFDIVFGSGKQRRLLRMDIDNADLCETNRGVQEVYLGSGFAALAVGDFPGVGEEIRSCISAHKRNEKRSRLSTQEL
jgi:hypothetical protein